MSDAATITTPAASAVTPAPGTPDATAQAAANTIAAQAAVTPQTPEPAKVADSATPQTPADVVYALALPKDAVIEASAVERLTSFAKEHKLAPDVAQKALDLANEEVIADRARAMTEFAKMPQKWIDEIKADPEFGGEKYLITVEEAKRSVDRFSTPEERKSLKESGWDNHPILVKWFARAGRAMANDKLVTGNSGGNGTPKTDAQALYPGMNP
jgi:hypothetical protein